MKWKTNNQIGNKRFVRIYAFFPTKLDDGYTVWLEHYWEVQNWDDGTTSTGHGYWKKDKTSVNHPELPDTGTPVRRP
jgi:hypothetical protein